MKNLILLIVASSVMTYSIQSIFIMAKKHGISSIFINPYFIITLCTWVQLFLLLCIADYTYKVIAGKENPQLFLLYGLLFGAVFVKTHMEQRKIDQNNKNTQETKNA